MNSRCVRDVEIKERFQYGEGMWEYKTKTAKKKDRKKNTITDDYVKKKSRSFTSNKNFLRR